MKYLILFLILLHGVIHLLGFFKAFHILEIRSLPLGLSKVQGIFWANAALLFLVYAVLYFLGASTYWSIGLAAILLSQTLIFLQWNQAGAGTLLNVLLALHCLTGYTFYQFDRARISGMRHIVQAAIPNPPGLITDSTIKDLPLPVRHWLRNSGVIGKTQIRSAVISQSASMKLRPDQKDWWSATALQNTYTPVNGFTWQVDVRRNAFLHFYGQDECFNGNGSMVITLNGWFPVVNAKGPKIDEGSMQRYLGEIVWCPMLALSPEISWEALNDSTAKATLRINDKEASGTFYWDQDGKLLKFTALRYMGNEPEAQRREWVLEVREHRSFQGIRVPAKMTATWMLDSGPWTWLELELTEVKYDAT